MICPQCKCEYIRGITQCADCGVPLVNALEPPPKSLEGVRLVPIWRGKDHAECERVIEALESAGIPHTDPASNSFFSFLPTDPNTEVWVSHADEERAKKILLDLEGLVCPEELTSEEAASFALPESDAPDDSDQQAEPPEDLPEYWYEDGAVAEVWHGDSREFADALAACLREIGIPSHMAGEPPRWSLVVPQNLQLRAREVVREVVEASPPK